MFELVAFRHEVLKDALEGW
jgi:hypothetical protein